MHFLLSVQRCFQHSSSQFMSRSLVCATNSNIISVDHLLRPCLPVSSQSRTFWESFPSIRPLFYEKDGLSRSKYELVYHARLFNYAFYGQLIGYTSFAGQLATGLYYAYCYYVAEKAIELATHLGPYVINYDLTAAFVITMLNIQCIVMLVAAQTACYRIYYCKESDKFVFISLAKNPFKSRLTYCNPGELVPLRQNPLQILFGNHKIDDKRLFIRPDNFKEMYMYNRLVGDNYA